MRKQKHNVGDLLYHSTCGFGLIIGYDPNNELDHPYLTWWSEGGKDGSFETRGHEQNIDSWKEQLGPLLKDTK